MMKILLTVTLTLIFMFISSFCLYCFTRKEDLREVCEFLSECIIIIASLTLSVWIIWR